MKSTELPNVTAGSILWIDMPMGEALKATKVDTLSSWMGKYVEQYKDKVPIVFSSITPIEHYRREDGNNS